MIILTLRTDKPEAELGLYKDAVQLGYKVWPAHRQLAETIHYTIKELLGQHDQTWSDIGGIVYYKGPGSFTGLRIGASVANALGAATAAPLVSRNGDDWIADGIQALQAGKRELALPYYGAEPHITKPKK